MKFIRNTYTLRFVMDVVMDEVLYAQEEFLDADHINTAIFYTEEGAIFEKYINHFDGMVRLTKVEYFDEELNVSQVDKFEYFQDGNSLKVMKSTEFKNGISDDQVVEYYQDDLIILRETRNGEELIESEKYIYENNELIRHIIADSYDNGKFEEEFLYNDNKVVIERFIEGELSEKETRIYEGKILKKMILEKEGAISKECCRYNFNNDVIEKTFFRDDKLISIRQYNYLQGLLIKEIYTDSLSGFTETVREIEYDLSGRKILERDPEGTRKYTYDES